MGGGGVGWGGGVGGGNHELRMVGVRPPPLRAYIYTRAQGGWVIARKALPSHPNLTCIWKLEGLLVPQGVGQDS